MGHETAGIDAHLAVDEAEYQGKKVTLNKPILQAKMNQKFKVYVKDGDKVKSVRFGHQGKGNEKTMKIKKVDPIDVRVSTDIIVQTYF